VRRGGGSYLELIRSEARFDSIRKPSVGNCQGDNGWLEDLHLELLQIAVFPQPQDGVVAILVPLGKRLKSPNIGIIKIFKPG
jgi:hypothetical protein